MADAEQAAVWHVLRALRRRGDEYIRHKLTKAAEPAWNIAKAKFSQMTLQQLNDLLINPGAEGSFEPASVVFLHPPGKDVSSVAALWCKWDYETEAVGSGFYFGQWMAIPDPAAPPAAGKTVTGFVGYRFESPEPKGSNHRYFHVQPCRSLGKKDDPIAQALPYSDRTPTFPVAARNSVELMLCLYMALYGLDEFKMLRNSLMGDAAMRKNIPLMDALKTILTLDRPEYKEE